METIKNNTDENLGPFFKKLRIAKGFTISEASGSQLSDTHLSNFENGRTNLSAHLFLALLANINVNTFEFQNAYNHDLQNKDIMLFNSDISDAFLSHNIVQLQHFLKILEENKETSKKDRLEKVRIKAILSVTDTTTAFTRNEINYLKNYLLSVKEWGYYEILLLSDCVPIFDVLTLSELIHHMLVPTQLNFNLIYIRQVRIQALLNAIDDFSKAKQFDLADEFIAYLEQSQIHDYWMFEKLTLIFRTAQNSYAKGNLSAFKTMQKCQDILEFCNCFKTATLVNNDIKKLK